MRCLIFACVFALAVLAAGCVTDGRNVVVISSPNKRVLAELPDMWSYDDPRFGIDREYVQNEQVHCLALAMWHQGFKVDYPYLMVISCAAANFHYNPNEKFWCYVLSPDPPDRRAASRMGFRFNHLKPDSADEAYSFIRRHITAGKLVVGSWYSPVMFYGYDERDEEPVLYYYNTPFAMKGAKWAMPEFIRDYWHADVPKELFAVTKRRGHIDHGPAVHHAMKRLVLCSKQNRLLMAAHLRNEDLSGIITGFKAYETYARDLEDMSKTMKKGHETDDEGYFDIGWGCYAIYPQWTARASTALFLRKYAPEFYDEIFHEYLSAAAEYYDREIEAWGEWEKHLGRDYELWEKDEEKATALFHSRWADPKHRKAGAKAVREALKWERLAVAEIEKVLRHSIKEN